MSGVQWARTLLYYRCYIDPKVTVITGVTWARTLPLCLVSHVPERYRRYRCYMGPNVTVKTGVTLARTLPL